MIIRTTNAHLSGFTILVDDEVVFRNKVIPESFLVQIPSVGSFFVERERETFLSKQGHVVRNSQRQEIASITFLTNFLAPRFGARLLSNDLKFRIRVRISSLLNLIHRVWEISVSELGIRCEARCGFFESVMTSQVDGTDEIQFAGCLLLQYFAARWAIDSS